MMLDKLLLGKKIKEARQQTGLNQSEFGKKIGIDLPPFYVPRGNLV